jgi:PTH1 family peptidyl-tRNA hydrolase
MRLIVGLGNPGRGHVGNRHNIGFMAVDAIVRRHSFAGWRTRGRLSAEVTETTFAGEKVIALKPTTYMNESGQAVGAAQRFYKLEPEAIVVLHDELDLAPGKVRVKLDGGSAGHNGLRSVSAHIGPDYWRVRLGIGHPGEKELVHPYVLSDFAKADQAWLEKTLDAVAEAFPLLIEKNQNSFMTRVALLTQPPRPAPKKPEPEATDVGRRDASESDETDGL